MAFIFTGEVATMREMLHRAGGPCDLVISLGWAESPQVMMGNLIELIRRTDIPEGKKILILTDPMGVVMRDTANNRINTGGPKDVFWYSPDPNSVAHHGFHLLRRGRHHAGDAPPSGWPV